MDLKGSLLNDGNCCFFSDGKHWCTTNTKIDSEQDGSHPHVENTGVRQTQRDSEQDGSHPHVIREDLLYSTRRPMQSFKHFGFLRRVSAWPYLRELAVQNLELDEFPLDAPAAVGRLLSLCQAHTYAVGGRHLAALLCGLEHTQLFT